MTIVLCGGGSGGHITPLLAVAREIRQLTRSNELKIIYIGEKGGKFGHIAADSGLFDECHYISAGKIRRYHGESWLVRLTDVKTIMLNFRDAFRLIKGTFQSIFLLKRLRPTAVLLKGGFVCVPVSIGASRVGDCRIVTHDSDAIPGLSNRFAARYASLHATGMPAQYYTYPPAKIRYVGLPIDDRYRQYSESEVRFLREKFNIALDARVVLLTGGSQGAIRLNEWALKALKDVLDTDQKLYIVAVVGAGNTGQIFEAGFTDDQLKRVHVIEFSDELFHLVAIADVVITRAGATTVCELAAQKKAAVIVPNPELTGGHQSKNASVYSDAAAAIVLTERDIVKDPSVIEKAIILLLNDPAKRKELGNSLHALFPATSAAFSLAKLLVE